MVFYQNVGTGDALTQARAGELVSERGHLSFERAGIGGKVLAMRYRGNTKTIDAVVRAHNGLR